MTARAVPWLLASWLLVAGAGSVGGSWAVLERERQAFEATAEAAQRWVSHQARQNELLLETLVMLQPRAGADGVPAEARLAALHPAVQRVLRHDGQTPWPSLLGDRLATAEAQSRRSERAALAQLDLGAGRYVIVRAGEPASFALQLDLRSLAAEGEPHVLAAHGPLRAWLEQSGQRRVLAPGAAGTDDAGGWRFDYRQRLQAETLPVDLVATRRVGWGALPWGSMLAWWLATALLTVLAGAWWQRRRQGRADVLSGFGATEDVEAAWMATTAPSRMGETDERGPGALSRSNPLFVTLREIDREPPELAVARGAIQEAARQARRTSEVISRISAHTEPGELAAAPQGLRLDELLRDTLELLEPECERLGVVTTVATDEEIGWVRADPIALEQVVHQLLRRSLDAVARVPAGERRVELTLAALPREVVLSVRDTGTGLPPDQVRRLFDARPPADGRGISLGTCRAMVEAMGGTLAATYAPPRGTLLRLVVPRHA